MSIVAGRPALVLLARRPARLGRPTGFVIQYQRRSGPDRVAIQYCRATGVVTGR